MNMGISRYPSLLPPRQNSLQLNRDGIRRFLDCKVFSHRFNFESLQYFDINAPQGKLDFRLSVHISTEMVSMYIIDAVIFEPKRIRDPMPVHRSDIIPAFAVHMQLGGNGAPAVAIHNLDFDSAVRLGHGLQPFRLAAPYPS
jgi:hypothetical protein